MQEPDNQLPDDPAAASTPFIARVAGGALMVTGLDCLIMAAQLLGFRLYGWLVAMPIVWLILGVGMIGVGFQLQRGRGWASLAGVAGALVLTVAGVAWAIYGLAHGFISLTGLALPPLGGVALFLCALAVEPALRVSRARKRLEEQGLGLGI